MSSFLQLQHRNGKAVKSTEHHNKISNSHNTRQHNYTNGIPKGGSKGREIKHFKTKRGYSNVQSKYSSVISKYLKGTNYSSAKAHDAKAQQPKPQKDRLMLRIFGNENNFKMIKSIVTNNTEPQDAYESMNKANGEGRFSRKHAQERKLSNIENNSPKPTDLTTSSKQFSKDKDIDVKLEKALLDLSEHK